MIEHHLCKAALTFCSSSSVSFKFVTLKALTRIAGLMSTGSCTCKTLLGRMAM